MRMQFQELQQALLGDWTGTKRLYLEPPPSDPSISDAKLAAIAVAGGNFIQFNYSWSYDGDEQTGVLLFGYDEENAASAAWVDSFHASGKILYCTGTAAKGTVDVRGSYAAPPGPDWGWRMVIRSVSRSDLQIVMHNISPEGQEDLAVEIDCMRTT